MMPSAYIPALYLVLVPPQNLLDEQPNSRIHFKERRRRFVISPAFGACSRPELMSNGVWKRYWVVEDRI